MNNYIRPLLKYFLQGVVIIGPLSTTIWILWSIFYKFVVEGLNYILEHTPGIKFIYKTIRDVIGSFVGDKQKFSHPVWVRVQESPELWRIGFLTQEDMSFASFSDMVSVYLPHSYAISGWVIVVHKDQIKPAEGFTAKQAMEFAVSGGTVGVRSEKKTVKSEES